MVVRKWMNPDDFNPRRQIPETTIVETRTVRFFSDDTMLKTTSIKECHHEWERSEVLGAPALLCVHCRHRIQVDEDIAQCYPVGDIIPVS